MDGNGQWPIPSTDQGQIIMAINFSTRSPESKDAIHMIVINGVDVAGRCCCQVINAA